jgi:hypothetical protein
VTASRPKELELIGKASRLAAIAIEQKRSPTSWPTKPSTTP